MQFELGLGVDQAGAAQRGTIARSYIAEARCFPTW
jgi:hypothetical protein